MFKNFFKRLIDLYYIILWIVFIFLFICEYIYLIMAGIFFLILYKYYLKSFIFRYYEKYLIFKSYIYDNNLYLIKIFSFIFGLMLIIFNITIVLFNSIIIDQIFKIYLPDYILLSQNIINVLNTDLLQNYHILSSNDINISIADSTVNVVSMNSEGNNDLTVIQSGLNNISATVNANDSGNTINDTGNVSVRIQNSTVNSVILNSNSNSTGNSNTNPVNTNNLLMQNSQVSLVPAEVATTVENGNANFNLYKILPDSLKQKMYKFVNVYNFDDMVTDIDHHYRDFQFKHDIWQTWPLSLPNNFPHHKHVKIIHLVVFCKLI